MPDSPGVYRTSIGIVVLLAAGLGACTPSGNRTPVVTLVTHSSPGGGSDVLLRELVPHLTRVMGRTFVVENIQGGSGAKAMATVAAAACALKSSFGAIHGP